MNQYPRQFYKHPCFEHGSSWPGPRSVLFLSPFLKRPGVLRRREWRDEEEVGEKGESKKGSGRKERKDEMMKKTKTKKKDCVFSGGRKFLSFKKNK